MWWAIDDPRLRTAELLEQLSEDEWHHASQCPGWTVRDVAAEKSGLTYETVLQRIINLGLRWQPENVA